MTTPIIGLPQDVYNKRRIKRAIDRYVKAHIADVRQEYFPAPPSAKIAEELKAARKNLNKIIDEVLG